MGCNTEVTGHSLARQRGLIIRCGGVGRTRSSFGLDSIQTRLWASESSSVTLRMISSLHF